VVDTHTHGQITEQEYYLSADDVVTSAAKMLEFLKSK
jgi:hypothetical protein